MHISAQAGEEVGLVPVRARALRPGLAISSLALALSACSSSSGGSDAIVALSAPSQVSVLTADEGPGATPDVVAPGGISFPATSDYARDRAEIYVYDPSMEALANVNNILCFMAGTGYPLMVNEGVYDAQINVTKCETGGNQSSSEGQSSGSVDELAILTVDCTRASNGASQFGRVWVPGDDGGTIYAMFEFTEGASAENPFGQFSMSFAGASDFASIGAPDMVGVLRTTDALSGSIGFQFYESQGDVTVAHLPGDRSRRVAFTVNMSVDQTTGAARVLRSERENFGSGDSGELTDEWKVAFNATHMKRQRNSDPVVTLSRSDFHNSVWRYDLYEASGPNAGRRVARNSGFGFRTDQGAHGWIGYWGMWLPQGTTVANGDTIYRETYDSSVGEAFEVVRAPGKLIRKTRRQMDLSELAGRSFEWWAGMDRFRVEYDLGMWIKTHQWNDVNESWDALVPTEVIDLMAAGGFLNMWSAALGGGVVFVAGDSFIQYFEESFVSSDDPLIATASGSTVALYGFVNCLDAGMSALDVEAGDIFLPTAANETTPHVYRFGVDDLTLYYDPVGDASVLEQVGLATGQQPSGGPFAWGMRSGPLVSDIAGMTSVFDIYDFEVFYEYETGPNDWNQYTAIKDMTDTIVPFDPPIQFLYTHSTANDRNGDSTYDGQAFVLQYEGNGSLGGIPYEGIDLTGDSVADRWYPLLNIEDMTLMGPTGTEYVIKALQIEQRLEEDPGGAPSLDINDADALTLPDAMLYTTPTIGERPVVTGPPSVVDGERVDS